MDFLATARDILRSNDVWTRAYRRRAVPEAVAPLCWHCSHPFEGIALQFPVRHDDRRNAFKVVGQFCSWPCVKAYNRDTYGLRSSINDVTIRHYYTRCTGRRDLIRSAPPRVALKAFGGHLAIEEFRQGFATHPPVGKADLVSLPVHFLGPFALAVGGPRSAATPSKRKATVPEGALDFADVNARDTLQLRRPKPLAVGQNTLERTLGLNSLIRR